MKIRNKQSLFDITVQNFGRMDELINVSRDNNLSISEYIETKQEIQIGNYEGNIKIKNAIALQNLTFNNDADLEFVKIIYNKVLENGDNKVLENGDNKILE